MKLWQMYLGSLIAGVAMAFGLSGCGSGDEPDWAHDPLNPDTHTIQTTIVEGLDGTSTTVTKDLGYIEEHQVYAREFEDGDSWIGESEQALTVNGRLGLDSVATGDAVESRCPVNGYTGSITVPGNHCRLAGTKHYYWSNAMTTEYDASFGSKFADLFQAARAGANGWGFIHDMFQSGSTPPRNAYIRFGDDITNCGGPALACAVQLWGPLQLSTQGKRYRKAVPTSQGFYVIIYIDPPSWTEGPTPAIIPGMTQTQRNGVAYNTFLHEMGHGMGLGHNPSVQGLSTFSVMKVGTGRTEPQTFLIAEKSDMQSYVP